MPIAYGKQLTISQDGNVITTREQTIYKFQTGKDIAISSEIVQIKNDKEYLTIFLKMLDQYNQGEIDLPGIQLLRDKETGQLRVEKTWVVV